MSPHRLSTLLQVVACALVVGLVAWLGLSLDGGAPGPTRAPTGAAPPVTVVVAGVPTASRAWTSCYGRPAGDGTTSVLCSDGAPGLDGKPLLDVGAVDAVAFSFPDPGWTFTASFHGPGPLAGADCAPTYPATVTTTGPHTFSVAPAGPAGRYRVDLEGRGPSGSVVTSILWSTPVAGPRPFHRRGGQC